MASIQQNLTAGVVSVVPLDAPTGRIVVTYQAGTTEAYVSVDGSLPVVPTPGVEVPTQQNALPAVVGAQTVLKPPLFGTHMVIPTVRMVSSGSPTISVEW